MEDTYSTKQMILWGVAFLVLFMATVLIAMNTFEYVMTTWLGMDAFSARVLFKGIATFVIVGGGMWFFELSEKKIRHN